MNIVILVGGTNDGRRIFVDDGVSVLKAIKRKVENPRYKVEGGEMTETHEDETYLIKKLSTPSSEYYIGIHHDISINIALGMIFERYAKP